MAIPMIDPLSVERMIDISRRKRRISRQEIDRVHKQRIQPPAKNALLFPSIIASEAPSVFSQLHSGSRAKRHPRRRIGRLWRVKSERAGECSISPSMVPPVPTVQDGKVAAAEENHNDKQVSRQSTVTETII